MWVHPIPEEPRLKTRRLLFSLLSGLGIGGAVHAAPARLDAGASDPLLDATVAELERAAQAAETAAAAG